MLLQRLRDWFWVAVERVFGRKVRYCIRGIAWQVHHIDAEGRHDFVAQSDYLRTWGKGPDAWVSWVSGVKSRHPLPDGHVLWYGCEVAPGFMFANRFKPVIS